MKNLLLLTFLSTSTLNLWGQIYFVTNYKNTPQIYGGSVASSYAGVKVFENYNLLATVLNDNPASLLRAGQTLVDTTSVTVEGQTLALQPFAFVQTANSRKQDLPMGKNLNDFLSNPLGVEKFDLTLPFNDYRVALSNRSAFLRIARNDSSIEFHTAIDFDRTDDSKQPFDVIAPADGTVFNGENNGTFAILHKTPRGKEFLTVYQHLDKASKAHYKDGDIIKRGQKIGVISSDGERYAHLHFGVAIKGPAGTVGGKRIQAQWYLIDPFGVYDYRKSTNYLPQNSITGEVKGVNKAFVFMTNPISGSFYLSNEDCISFNPLLLAINKLPSGEYQLSAGDTTIDKFSNIQDAGKAMQIIKKYGYTQRCFAGRPVSRFQYFK